MTSPRRRAAIAMFLPLCAFVAARAQPATRPVVDEVKLAAIDAKAGAITDLTADFTQEKFSPLLRDPIRSSGTIRSKGSAQLWETNQPEPTRTRVDPERLQIFYVSRNTVEDYPIAGKLGSLAASPLPRLATLRERFEIAADAGEGIEVPAGVTDPVYLKLVPKEPEVKQYVHHVRVLLDGSRGLLLAFELVDPDDERTVIRFSNLKTDARLTDDDLKLNAPANATIAKPLG